MVSKPSRCRHRRAPRDFLAHNNRAEGYEDSRLPIRESDWIAEGDVVLGEVVEEGVQ